MTTTGSQSHTSFHRAGMPLHQFQGVYTFSNLGSFDRVPRLEIAENTTVDILDKREVAADLAFLSQLWLVEPIPSKKDVYTIRSISAGVYLNLEKGQDHVNNLQVATGKAPPYTTYWAINKNSSSASYRIRNVVSDNSLCLEYREIPEGEDGFRAQVHPGFVSDDSLNQMWKLEAKSLTGLEIIDIIKKSPNLHSKFECYRLDANYMILDETILHTIWKSSGLGEMEWRRDIFDCDDFALVLKADVAKWAYTNIKADNIAVLCGCMVGENEVEAHAYNWNIKGDMNSVYFIEPQDGTVMDHMKYQPKRGFF